MSRFSWAVGLYRPMILFQRCRHEFSERTLPMARLTALAISLHE